MTIFATSDWTGIQINGDKAAEFLQGQVTCDVAELNDATSHIAAFCNHQGRVLFSGRLLKSPDGFWLLLPGNLVEIATAHIEKYGIFSQITVQPLNWQLMARDSLTDGAPEEIDQVQHQDQIVICHSANSWLILSENAPTAGAKNDYWRWLNIQARIALLCPETSGKFTPHMLGYPECNAVSFTKGCYVGQEIIARTHHLGQAKRGLQLHTVDQAYAPGERCDLGQVVDCQANPDGSGYSALIVG